MDAVAMLEANRQVLALAAKEGLKTSAEAGLKHLPLPVNKKTSLVGVESAMRM